MLGLMIIKPVTTCQAFRTFAFPFHGGSDYAAPTVPTQRGSKSTCGSPQQRIDNLPNSPKMETMEILPRIIMSQVRQVLERLMAEDHWLPVEVKWSAAPTERDVRHLKMFLSEYPQAHEGVVVCRTPRQFKLCPNITALPWQEIPELLARIQ
jgi:hypothetical protein